MYSSRRWHRCVLVRSIGRRRRRSVVQYFRVYSSGLRQRISRRPSSVLAAADFFSWPRRTSLLSASGAFCRTLFVSQQRGVKGYTRYVSAPCSKQQYPAAAAAAAAAVFYISLAMFQAPSKRVPPVVQFLNAGSFAHRR